MWSLRYTTIKGVTVSFIPCTYPLEGCRICQTYRILSKVWITFSSFFVQFSFWIKLPMATFSWHHHLLVCILFSLAHLVIKWVFKYKSPPWINNLYASYSKISGYFPGWLGNTWEESSNSNFYILNFPHIRTLWYAVPCFSFQQFDINDRCIENFLECIYSFIGAIVIQIGVDYWNFDLLFMVKYIYNINF